MSEMYFDKEDFRKSITNRMIKTYISDAVWRTMQNMDFEHIYNEAYNMFFEKVEKIVRSEKLDDTEKVEKLLRLIQKYEIKLY